MINVWRIKELIFSLREIADFCKYADLLVDRAGNCSSEPTSLLACLPSRVYLDWGSSLTSVAGATGFPHDRDTLSSLFKHDTHFFRRARARSDYRFMKDYGECIDRMWILLVWQARNPIGYLNKSLSKILQKWLLISFISCLINIIITYYLSRWKSQCVNDAGGTHVTS